MSRFINNQLDLQDVLLAECNERVRPKSKFSCKNPHHSDSDASCIYYGNDRGTYCFGCGKAYFALDYIMFARDLTYYESLTVAESDYGVDTGRVDDVKVEGKADIQRYSKLSSIPVKGKKALHNYCRALKAISDENDTYLTNYLTMKGLNNG